MGSFMFFLSVTYILILLISLKTVAFALPVIWANLKNDSGIPRIVSREEWGARPPVDRVSMQITPTPYVVVHHGGIADYCDNQKACSAIVRSYQNLHLDDRGWFDIGYSFVIGEDGNAYEGRGWNYVGAHAPGYNQQSIGICVIGEFSDFLPNKVALKTLNDLIDYGVSLGKISENYQVIGHRQARNTLCPGEEFYKFVQTHPRWTPKPVPTYSSTTTATMTTERTTIMNEHIANANKKT